MDSVSTLAVTTAFTGMLMAVSPGLQIKRMLSTGTSEDVSIGYFAVLCVGFVLWVAYGLSIGSVVVWACNTVATVFGLSTILVAWHFRRHPRPQGLSDGNDLPESRA